MGALRQPMEAVPAAPQAPNTAAPQVTEVGYYSNSKLTKPLSGTIRPGTTIFTKVVFSEPMQYRAADDQTARPILYYRINGKRTRYRIAKRGARGADFVSGDAKPIKGGTDDYICKFTVPEEVTGQFTLAVGKLSTDKEGNTLAKFYAHKTKLSIKDNSQPVIKTIIDQTLDVGDETMVAVNITDADADDRHTISASSADTAIASVTINNTILTIRSIAVGTTTITVSATDDSREDNAAATPVVFKVIVNDPYTPFAGLTVAFGRVVFKAGGLSLQAGGCIFIDGSTFNGVKYDSHSFKWQRREDAASPWVDIPGTEEDRGICGYRPDSPGQYRAIWDVSIGGVRRKYRSANILTVR